ncbi:MAG: Sensory box histidine kinase [Myxococcales bacterium]|nr:Sensory box histidine kinase [Myxococcales bacterium]
MELMVDRTTRIQRLTVHLSTALRMEEVAQTVIDESATALGAHSAALWSFDHTAGELVLLRANNYPEVALATVRRIPIAAAIPVAEAARTGEPIWLSSRTDYEARYPVSEGRARGIAPGPTYSIASLPIVVSGRVLGVLALTFIGDRAFDADERSYLMYLAVHCAQAFDRARLHEAEMTARRQAESAQVRATFLARASELLGSSLDYQQTLRNVAALAVPGIGDWCGVELVDDKGVPQQVAVAHIDPAKIELAHALRHKYPVDPAAPSGVPNILRTGKSELYPEIPDALLVASAIDDEHLRITRALGLTSAMAVPVKDRGTTIGAISFILTDERRYTPDDLQMAEQLGERAGAAIANAKLYDEATRAIRLRDEFLLIAGHELRTPLAAITLHHQALARTPDSTPISKIRDKGVRLVSQSDRLEKLIEELLDVSRISAGRLTLTRETVDLALLVHTIVERMRDDADRNRSTVQLTTERAIGFWDRSRVDQIVTNLISNAIKYGGGQPIDVKLAREDDEAVLTVRDRGIGIAPADQARIFERFERAVSARNFGGLGLGLWIVRQLVESHGGTIAVESVKDEGSTFVVRLPLTATPA